MRKNRGFKQCCLYMEMKTTAIDFHFELTERLSYCTYCTVQKTCCMRYTKCFISVLEM